MPTFKNKSLIISLKSSLQTKELIQMKINPRSITNYLFVITNYQFVITNYLFVITNYLFVITD